MSVAPFASLTAGLLARKGEAKPSHEPKMDVPTVQPLLAPTVAPPARSQGSAPAPIVGTPDMKVRLGDVVAAWPAPKSHAPAAAPGMQLPDHKTTIRLTHAQARAVRLAALVLDRPQQDILTAGLLRRLEALACADLANCACFKEAVESLRKPAPPAGPQSA